MRKVAMASLILLLFVGLSFAKDYEISKKAGEYTLRVNVDKNPPTTGKNRIEISIKDVRGDVKDAALMIEYGMPAMPGMGAMNYKVKGEIEGSRYGADLNFSMPGSWYVTIKITRSGKTQTAKLNIDVR